MQEKVDRAEEPGATRVASSSPASCFRNAFDRRMDGMDGSSSWVRREEERIHGRTATESRPGAFFCAALQTKSADSFQRLNSLHIMSAIVP